MKHLVRAFLTDLGGNPNKRNALNETALHATCQISPNSINGSQDRRAICVQFLLHWRGAILPSGGREKVDLAAQDDLTHSSEMRPISPVLEAPGKTAFLTEDPRDIIKNGTYNQVPIVLGYTDKEGYLLDFMRALVKEEPKPLELEKELPFELNLKPDSDELKNVVALIGKFYSENQYDDYDIITDSWFLAGIVEAAEKHLETSKHPVYLYRMSICSNLNYFKAKTRPLDSAGASHADDLGYLWHMEVTPEFERGSVEDRYMRIFVDLWTNFAQFGNPTVDDSLGVSWSPIERKKELRLLDIGQPLAANLIDKDQLAYGGYAHFSKVNFHPGFSRALKRCWSTFHPLLGVGFCAVLVAFYVSFYYNVILAWALYYLGSSISAELPWMHCNNSWNTEQCWELRSLNETNRSMSLVLNETLKNSKHTPAFEFFHRAVLEMQWSDGLHEMGYPKWQLVVCLILIYCLLYVSLFKGVKSSGKVVWVTATMPYVVLSILLVRGLMLPGALGGISYYLQPELSKLKETQVWVDAAVQIFYSVGAGFGVHLSYASYNTFHNNCYRDCIITTVVNCFTSFFSGFVIFTYLGYMSHKQGVDIKYVATEGPGLVFQVYPEAVATLPGSHLWSVLFFFMLIMLGVDSAMGGLECVITGLMDEFSSFFRQRKYAREIFTLIVILTSFSVALINVTPGGIYMFHLFDTYSAGISLLCSALFEAIAVSWFYGLDRLTQDVEAMLGMKPGIYWRVCWKFISPSFIVCVVMFGLLYHQPLVYNDYSYPNWAEWVGWSLALSSIMMIPLGAIIQLCKTPGSFKERVALSISPVEEHEEIRRSKLVRRFRAKHWFYI
ncbi:hypothetical protein HUJ04_013165 [Dendroctonus ponderosae]|nr:hypothetical protein HUJ04_013165 [Dendroctonus ponderosae]